MCLNARIKVAEDNARFSDELERSNKISPVVIIISVAYLVE